MIVALTSLTLIMLEVAMAAAIPVGLSQSELQDNEIHSYAFPFVTRDRWHAREAMATTPLVTPVPYVVIHHSYTPAACHSPEECAQAMRAMQNMHMDDNKWWDIGYNFAVGGDGSAYEGRGWSLLGAHAKHFNSVSIGICIIGDWTSEFPPSNQLKAAQALIAAGVEQGYIRPDYRLVGHRQVRATECPGDAFMSQLKTWPHYSNFPASYKDLVLIPEISMEVKEILRSNVTSIT